MLNVASYSAAGTGIDRGINVHKLALEIPTGNESGTELAAYANSVFKKASQLIAPITTNENGILYSVTYLEIINAIKLNENISLRG